MNLYYQEMKSPVGKLKLVADEKSLVAILWENDRPERVDLPGLRKAKKHEVLERVEAQLREYFSGERTQFDLPLNPRGTDFQKKVWLALRKIPFGTTKSYGELAKSIGSPKASRAVGAANGKNPLSIVVPCHRVIGANGTLTGFAGGIPAKAFLLRLEKGDSLLF